MRAPSPAKRPANIRIGLAGWSYPDWVGVVYPKPLPRGYNHLARIASWFDMVEINASFYKTPAPAHAARWVEQVAAFPDFRFTAKLNRAFTHDRRIEPTAVSEFQRFLIPLVESRRLMSLLLQFPWSFRASADNWGYLQSLSAEFANHPLVVEFRHDSWWQSRWFDKLRASGLSLANIDQPALENNIPPGEVLTGATAYIRFHGRNSEAWWAPEEAYYGARYDYLYNAAELSEWAERATRMAIQADNTIVVFNNHHRGDAVVGALQFAALLHQQRGEIPATLRDRYPDHYRLLNLPVEKEDVQGDLFG